MINGYPIIIPSSSDCAMFPAAEACPSPIEGILSCAYAKPSTRRNQHKRSREGNFTSPSWFRRGRCTENLPLWFRLTRHLGDDSTGLAGVKIHRSPSSILAVVDDEKPSVPESESPTSVEDSSTTRLTEKALRALEREFPPNQWRRRSSSSAHSTYSLES